MEPMIDLSLRLATAAVVGGAIGLNRDLHGKPTGVRTMGLVGLGSALIVVGGVVVGGAGDATRAAQGVMTGVGFLGAGVIVKDGAGSRVHGLTTAATIWLTAALGVTCGLGEWRLSLVALGLSLAVLMIGGPLEKAARTRWPQAPRASDPPE